ncbi:MAG: FAD-dependent oxidoreductase [Porticoccaceae bacterium]
MADNASFDVAVIGGGIHGAGVAQAAAAAGYTVALIEKTAWAAGTSSKSSKLIHGGLRYLAGGHLGLVRESLRERATLLRIAPHLVRIERFHIPLYRESRLRSWQLIAGLSLYAALSGGGANSGFSPVPRRCWPALTGLKAEGLRAIWRYWDARTNNSALTRAVVNSAQQLGARLFCPATVVGAEQLAGGYRVRLQSSGDDAEIPCKVLANCAGPWVNRVAERIAPGPPRLAVDLVQGTHLVLSAPVVEQLLPRIAHRRPRRVPAAVAGQISARHHRDPVRRRSG